MLFELFFRPSLNKLLIMKQLKTILSFLAFAIFFISCGSYPTKNNATVKEDPVVISNETLGYEVIIIDIGFTSYLNTVAKPKNYHSDSYLKNKNRQYVAVWNSRVRNPQRYNSNIYENIVDYENNINYGLEVNYKLYWYFKFAEQKYKMKLSY